MLENSKFHTLTESEAKSKVDGQEKGVRGLLTSISNVSKAGLTCKVIIRNYSKVNFHCDGEESKFGEFKTKLKRVDQYSCEGFVHAKNQYRNGATGGVRLKKVMMK